MPRYIYADQWVGRSGECVSALDRSFALLFWHLSQNRRSAFEREIMSLDIQVTEWLPDTSTLHDTQYGYLTNVKWLKKEKLRIPGAIIRSRTCSRKIAPDRSEIALFRNKAQETIPPLRAKDVIVSSGYQV